MDGYSILIIDDDDFEHYLLDEFLSELGYNIFHSTDGNHGLKTLSRHVPDLILLDILMPEIDGFRVLEKIRSQEKYESIPVVFLSKVDQTNYKARAFNLGAKDYITKPYNLIELHWRIRANIKSCSKYQQVVSNSKGTIEDIGVMTLLQTLILSQKDAILNIPEFNSSVESQYGYFINAKFMDFADDEALNRLLFIEKGNYSISYLKADTSFRTLEDIKTSLMFNRKLYQEISENLLKFVPSLDSIVYIKEDEKLEEPLSKYSDRKKLTITDLLLEMEESLENNAEKISSAFKKGLIKLIN
jgi:DNA-binding response OmpR family regulator